MDALFANALAAILQFTETTSCFASAIAMPVESVSRNSLSLMFTTISHIYAKRANKTPAYTVYGVE